LFRQRQTALGGHPPVNRELFGAGLFIRRHEKRMRQKMDSRKRRAKEYYPKSGFRILSEETHNLRRVTYNLRN
jgi:hypothetical protein